MFHIREYIEELQKPDNRSKIETLFSHQTNTKTKEIQNTIFQLLQERLPKGFEKLAEYQEYTTLFSAAVKWLSKKSDLLTLLTQDPEKTQKDFLIHHLELHAQTNLNNKEKLLSLPTGYYLKSNNTIFQRDTENGSMKDIGHSLINYYPDSNLMITKQGAIFFDEKGQHIPLLKLEESNAVTLHRMVKDQENDPTHPNKYYILNTTGKQYIIHSNKQTAQAQTLNTGDNRIEPNNIGSFGDSTIISYSTRDNQKCYALVYSSTSDTTMKIKPLTIGPIETIDYRDTEGKYTILHTLPGQDKLITYYLIGHDGTTQKLFDTKKKKHKSLSVEDNELCISFPRSIRQSFGKDNSKIILLGSIIAKLSS